VQILIDPVMAGDAPALAQVSASGVAAAIVAGPTAVVVDEAAGVRADDLVVTTARPARDIQPGWVVAAVGSVDGRRGQQLPARTDGQEQPSGWPGAMAAHSERLVHLPAASAGRRVDAAARALSVRTAATRALTERELESVWSAEGHWRASWDLLA